jgi:hypothetical protein
VNPNIFYGLDFKEDTGEGYICSDSYRKFMSKLKLTMLNEAILDGKWKINFDDKYDRYVINEI